MFVVLISICSKNCVKLFSCPVFSPLGCPPRGLSRQRHTQGTLCLSGRQQGPSSWAGKARPRCGSLPLDAGPPPVGEDPRASEERHPFTVKSCPHAMPFLPTMGEASWAPGPCTAPQELLPSTDPALPARMWFPLRRPQQSRPGETQRRPRELPECPWKSSPALAKEKSGFKHLSNPG